MRRPTERLPQRRLVYELRALIDRGRVEEARALLNEHPRGRESEHVRHNIGRARARLLGAYEALVRSLPIDPTWCGVCWHVHLGYSDESCVSCGCST